MKLKNLADVENALRPYVPLVKQLTGKDTVMTRIVPLMKYLGDPQERLRTIHIAGTSGKTSTAYYVSALLCAAGKKVGLTVSPHIDSILERVQVNGAQIPETEFCVALGEFLELVQKSKIQPSYFELMYAFAIWELDRRHVEYAVVETGMGGLFDATNIVSRADKVCVITDIGFDHMHILGKTIPEIALQKIGIVHPGNEVIMYTQSEEIMSVVREWVGTHRALLHETNEEAERKKVSPFSALMPAFQQRNWLLAQRAFKFVQSRDQLLDLSDVELRKTQSLQVPGRMDIVQIRDKTIIMDGAHNVQKLTTFIESFHALYPDSHPTLLVGMKDDKDISGAVSLLAQLSRHVITSSFAMTQDLPVKAIDPAFCASLFKAQGVEDVLAINNLSEAFETLLNRPEKICIITGSFYLLSQVRDTINYKHYDSTHRGN